MVRWRRPKSFPASAEMLAQVAVLALLSQSARETLAAEARWSTYPEGEEVDWEPNERGSFIFGVVEGSLQISFRSAEGKEMPVTLIPQGGFFDPGEDGWAGVDETVATSITEKAIVCSFSRQAFDDAVTQCPEAERLLHTLNRVLVRELGGLASDRLHGPAARVRHALWRDSRPEPDQSVSYTHEQLAARASTDRSKATRVVGELRRDGVIRVERRGNRIIVLDPDRLAEDE